MLGRRSLQRKLLPYVDNIHRRQAIITAREREEPVLEDYHLLSLFTEEDVPMTQKMGDFTTACLGDTTSAIVLPETVRSHEVKPQYQQLLPSFHALPGEDALKFLRKFCATVQNFPLGSITEEQLKMKCFPLTLMDRAETWYMTLAPKSITDWKGVCEKFMMKYYPIEKTQQIRTKIMNFAQDVDEPFHEAWERYQELLQQCPHHRMPQEVVWQFFYEGLDKNNQFMVDTTAGGKIARKTADEMHEIFKDLVESSQQKSTRSRAVQANAVGANPDITRQLADVMRDLQELKMAIAHPPASPVQTASPAPPQQAFRVQELCGICGESGHTVERCTRMAEKTYEGGADVYAAQGFPHQNMGPSQNFQNRRPQQFNQHPFYPQQQPYYPPPQPHYNQVPFNSRQPQPQYPPQQLALPAPQQPLALPAPPQKSIEEKLAAFMEKTEQLMQESRQAREATNATIKRLEGTMGQISGTVHQLQQGQQVGIIPSQGLQPHEAQSIAVLHEGQVVESRMKKEARSSAPSARSEASVRWAHKASDRSPASGRWSANISCRTSSRDRGTPPVSSSFSAPDAGRDDQAKVQLHKSKDPYIPPIPSLSKLKWDQQFGKLFEKLSEVDVNRPLLEDVRTMPAYAPFFKDLISKKKDFEGTKPVEVSKVASSMIQQSLPQPQRDPGSFVLDISFGNAKKASCMLDLGADINLMPYSMFKHLDLGELKPSHMRLRLADRSIRYAKGIIENVLISVGGLIVPTDFVVLDMGEVHENGLEHTVLLGRAFMATTNTVIDVKNAVIKMSVLGRDVSFVMDTNCALSAPKVDDDCSSINTIEALVEKVSVQDCSSEEETTKSAPNETLKFCEPSLKEKKVAIEKPKEHPKEEDTSKEPLALTRIGPPCKENENGVSRKSVVTQVLQHHLIKTTTNSVPTIDPPI